MLHNPNDVASELSSPNTTCDDVVNEKATCHIIWVEILVKFLSGLALVLFNNNLIV